MEDFMMKITLPKIYTAALMLSLLITAAELSAEIIKKQHVKSAVHQSAFTDLSAEQGMELIKRENPMVIDVRTKAEFIQGHIKGAILLPLQSLESHVDLIKRKNPSKIMLYCRSGRRSKIAAKILFDKGIKNIYNLKHGIIEWKLKGYRLTDK